MMTPKHIHIDTDTDTDTDTHIHTHTYKPVGQHTLLTGCGAGGWTKLPDSSGGTCGWFLRCVRAWVSGNEQQRNFMRSSFRQLLWLLWFWCGGGGWMNMSALIGGDL